MVTRRRYITSITATTVGFALGGCVGGDSGDDANGGNGNSDDTGNGNDAANATVEWNHREYDRVRFPHQSEGVSFVSDDETQYVGVQLKLTNETSETQSFVSVGAPEVTLFADGSNDAVSIHLQSPIATFDEVAAGETVQEALLYSAPPAVSTYTYDVRGGMSHTYDIHRDEDLEINLVSVSESG